MDLGTQAKAMVLVEPRHFAPTTLDLTPTEEGGWLAVEATGISGSDVHVWKGESPGVIYPWSGHQIVGRIAVKARRSPTPSGRGS